MARLMSILDTRAAEVEAWAATGWILLIYLMIRTCKRYYDTAVEKTVQ